jgi:hypothetical protein
VAPGWAGAAMSAKPIYVLRWEDPPPPMMDGWASPQLPRQEITERFVELRLNPKRWGVVYEHDDKQRVSMMVSRLKKRHPGFEIVSRRTPEGRALYARWTG